VTAGTSDTMRAGRAVCAAALDARSRRRRGCVSRYFLTSSQRKNGPPISAVTTPTGSSPETQIVRAIASQVDQKRGAEQR